MQATYINADQAIAAYDAFVFQAVGKAWGELQDRQATVLAFYAEDACKAVTYDHSVNDVTKAYYKEQKQFFKNIQ